MKLPKVTPIFLLAIIAVFSNLSTSKIHAQQGWYETGLDSLSLPLDNGINAVAADNAGNVYAAGWLGFVAVWDGKHWSELGKSSNPFIDPLSSFNGTMVNRLVFDHAGNLYAAGDNSLVEKWDGSVWQSLTNGNFNYSGDIDNLVADEHGNIYASGTLRDSLNNIAVIKWNGNKWSEVGTGIADTGSNASIYDGITAMAVDAADNVYISPGFITDVNGNYYITKWNGSVWSELSGLVNQSSILSIATDKNGNVYASGYFTNGANNHYVAKWNDTSWSQLGTGSNALSTLYTGSIIFISSDSAGNIYAEVQKKDTLNSPYYLTKWNGTSWSKLGGIADSLNGGNSVETYVTTSGKVYAMPGSKLPDGITKYITLWDGTTWQNIALNNTLANTSQVTAMAKDNKGAIYVAATYATQYGSNIYKLDNIGWSTVGNLVNINVTNMIGDISGNIYAAVTDANSRHYITEWNGVSWNETGGTNALGTTAIINSLCADTKGNIYAFGLFKLSGITTYAVKWNGSLWTGITVGNNLSSYISSSASVEIAADTSGNIYLATGMTDSIGNLLITKWDGTTWSSQVVGNIPTGYTPNNIGALTSDNNGYIYAAVSIEDDSVPNSYTYISKWDGTQWSTPDTSQGLQKSFLYNGAAGIGEIVVDNSTGILYAVDDNANSIDKWDGTTWSNLGNKNFIGVQWGSAHLIQLVSKTIYSGAFLDLDSFGYAVVYAYHDSATCTPMAPSVSINASSLSTCLGNNITFTATPAYGGNAPVYQWYKNGSATGINSNTYSSNSLNNNDSIWCVVTSNYVCATKPTATSNTIKITILQPTLSNTTASICSGQGGYLFNGRTYTSTATDTAHLTNKAGCDSAAILHLIVLLQPTSSNTTASICNGQGGYLFNGHTYTTTSDDTAHLTNKAGCDSAAILHLTVLQPTSSNTKASICNGQGGYLFNGQTYTSTGTDTAHLTNKAGCDSSAILHLTVHSGPYAHDSVYADTAVAHHWFVINQCTGTPPLSFIWNWGDGSAVSTGATPTHTYTQGGVYTICVTVTDSFNCSNMYCDSSKNIYRTTATPITVTVVLPTTGVQNVILHDLSIKIYPNPANNIITIHIDNYAIQQHIQITDMLGRVVYTGTLSHANTSIDLSGYSSGIYTYNIYSNVSKATGKFVVQK